MAISLVLVVCVSVLASCGKKDDGSAEKNKIIVTEAQINEKLSDSDGELTIEGSYDNVTSFTYVVSGVDASNLSNKTFIKNAVTVLLTDSSQLTFGQYKVCKAFSAVMYTCDLFDKDDDADFDSDEYIDEILAILCDGTDKTYENWTVSAKVNVSEDSITVSAVSK